MNIMITLEYQNDLNCFTIFSSSFSDPLLMEGLLHYIASFGSS